MTLNIDIYEALYRLNIQKKIDINLLKKAFYNILKIEDEEIRCIILGSFCTGLIAQNPTADEVCALIEVAFQLDNFNPYSVPVMSIKDHYVVESIGSGKKGYKTINISTGSAIVAAATGAYVIKKGSFSTSSITGSADFMKEFDVKTNHCYEDAKKILEKCGLVFMSIEDIIPNFDKIYGGRFYAPQILSFGLAAIVGNYRGNVLLYGLAHPNISLSVNVLKNNNINNALVVSSTDDDIHYLDEIGIYGNTYIQGIKEGIIGNLYTFNPVNRINIPKYTPVDIYQGDSKSSNIKHVINALSGKGKDAHIDIICINAANILFLAKKVENIEEGFLVSKKTISSGKAIEKFEEFISLSGGSVSKLQSQL